MAEEHAAEPDRVRPRRASTYLAAVVAALTAAGALYLAVWPRTVTVYAAAADLPAYWQLEQRDVRAVELPARAVPDDAVRTKDGLMGRYTRSRVRQDEPFTRSRLGPQLARRDLNGLRIVAVDGTVPASAAGTLAAGDRVDVLLPQQTGAAIIREVLVVDVRKAPEAVVLAIDEPQQRQLARVVAATAGPVLIRLPPAAP